MAITLPKISLAVLVLMGIIASVTPSATPSSTTTTNNSNDLSFHSKRKELVFDHLRRASRFLADRVWRCDESARVCRTKGSPGPNCCNKKCVNVMRDKLNCSKCGKKCKYLEICYKGGCVNPSKDEKHCGRCNNYCGKGNSCSFGLCSYA